MGPAFPVLTPLPDSPFACVIERVAFLRRRTKSAIERGRFRQCAGRSWSDRPSEGHVTDDAIAKNILKFVRQLDGVENDERLLEAAIAHHWLDQKGVPTVDGRKLIDSFHTLQKIGRPTV